MADETLKQEEVTLYPLFGGGTTPSRDVAEKAKDIFIDTFSEKWNEGNGDIRLGMIRFVRELEPEEGVGLAVIGCRDFTRTIREEAKQTLNHLASKITVSDPDPEFVPKETAIKSEKFSQAILKEMKKIISLDEIRGYLSVLLGIGCRGPAFAWKFYLKNIIPPNVFVDIVRRFPDPLRLRFVYQCLFSEVSYRRKQALAIRLLLKDISDTDAARDFIISVMDNRSDCWYANVSRSGSLLFEFMDGLGLPKHFIAKGLKPENTSDIIIGAKFASIVENRKHLKKFLHYLSGDRSDKLKLSLLEVFGRSHVDNDPRVIRSLSALLEDKNPQVVIEAFKTLLLLSAPETETIACKLVQNNPSMRLKLYKCLCTMPGEALIRVLDSLPDNLAHDARRTIARMLLRNTPQRLDTLFGYYKTDSDAQNRSAAKKLFDTIETIRKQERDEILENLAPPSVTKPNTSQAVTQKSSGSKLLKKLSRLASLEPDDMENMTGEIFIETDLKGHQLKNVDLKNALFSHTDLSSVNFSSINLKGARFDNVNLQNATFNNVCFDQCVFINIDAGGAHFTSCTFVGSCMSDSSFEFAELPGALFTGASVVNTNFSRSDLSFSSFTGSTVGLCDFTHSSLFQADFFHTTFTLCNFSDSDISTAQINGHSTLAARSEQWNDIDIPQEFYSKKLLDTRWLNILILTNEMDRRREIFIRYNNRCKERTYDAFRPEQEELFELVPLLIHLTQRVLPIEKKSGAGEVTENILLKNASSGISHYIPTQKTVALAKKHLGMDKLLLLPGKECNIEALFTIGSIGTIAQSANSDIDYWVCVDTDKMGDDAVELLKLKLESIEKWARVKFGTELHFFIVDPVSVREGLFGGSDFESSGSAQGMILKEEFYRTMILVAGKIPFWGIIPAWADDRYYKLLFSIARRFHDEYLDLGNVSTIPSGEYFGASMWQLFKSLTSPYKSVMKMALLEKYMQEAESGLLLCNRLKQRWGTGRFDLIRHDPYLLLFEEITDYYQSTSRKDILSLVQLCFFMKLGIRSMKHLDKSAFKFRKLAVQRCMHRFDWKEEAICDLGYFDEWPYEKVLNLSTLTSNYMISTYRKLSSMLNGSPGSEAIITARDLTVLGRKMFVQFSSQPHKVAKLPHVARGRNLFKQLYLYYRQRQGQPPAWEVYPRYDKTSIQKGSDDAILKEIEHIEQIAAWIIHNDIYSSGTTFTVLPNPTSISAQDFNDLLKEMNGFFTPGEGDTMPSGAYLEQFKVHKLYIIANFSTPRKSDSVIEYATIYMTTWGELFCRVYQSKKGLQSIAEVIDKVKTDLGIPFNDAEIDCHIPKMARKRIMGSL